MKKTFLLLSAACAGILSLATTAQATVLTYEGFNYSSGAGLTGLNGGTGWRTSGTWNAEGVNGFGTNGTIASTGLNYTTAGYTSEQTTHLPTSGRAVTAGRNHRYIDMDANGVYDTAGYRDGANRLGANAAGGQGNINAALYGSFLIQSSDWTSARMIFELNDNGAGTSNQLRIGQSAAGSGFSLSNGDGNGLSSVSAAPSSSNTYLFVFRIDFSSTANGDNLTFWLNPEAGNSAPTTGGIGLTTTRNFTFNNVELRAVNGNVVFDEVRFGTSWGDVAPIPEPTSALLAALGAGLLVLRRRRR